MLAQPSSPIFSRPRFFLLGVFPLRSFHCRVWASFFFVPFSYFIFLLSLSLPVVTQIRGNTSGSSPPSSLRSHPISALPPIHRSCSCVTSASIDRGFGLCGVPRSTVGRPPVLYGRACSPTATAFCRQCSPPRAFAPIPTVPTLPDTDVRPAPVALINKSYLRIVRPRILLRVPHRL